MAKIEVSYTEGEVYYHVDPCPFCGEDSGELCNRSYPECCYTEYWIECAGCCARGPNDIH